MQRALGSFEQALIAAGAFAPILIVTVLELESAPSDDALRRSLRVLMRRHPLLGSRIERRGGAPSFAPAGDVEVPLENAERRDEQAWIAVAEGELNRPIDTAAGPLFRCICLRGDTDRAEIVSTFHHAASDGVSLLRFTKDLLNLARSTRDPGDEAAGALPPPAEARYPRAWRGSRWTAAATRVLARQARDELHFLRRSQPGQIAKPGTPTRCRIRAADLAEPATGALVQACRRERVGVHDALYTAILRAVQHQLYADRDTVLRAMSFHDLRPHLDPPADDRAIFCATSPSRFALDLDARTPFWELARRFQRAARAASRSGQPFVMSRLMKPLMRVAISTRAMRIANTALSYMGDTGLEATYGSIGLRRLHAFVSNHALGPEYCSWAHLSRSRLQWDSVHLEADMQPERAAAIDAEILRTLETAAGPEPA